MVMAASSLVLAFLSGPSRVSLAPKQLAPSLPDQCFLFPSRVAMSMTEEMRPPYSAPKPPVKTSALRMMSVIDIEQSHEADEEHDSIADDKPAHAMGDDEVRGLARLVVHHALTGWYGGQRQGCEGVHNQVDPKHLGDC